jgi:alkanesulfonate monooxygenase SsuD/methylene tetrahydromethanopterin reductase-like flavin-dependent oxidoreductase (luciferase family)
MKIGYFLSSEEWGPRELVELAVKAQRAGFEDLWISDHFHPWNDEQGHSPIGPDQDAFFEAYREHVLPCVR